MSKVSKLREEAGMTQQQAAEATGIPLSTFQNYDQGRTEPPADRMRLIRRVLGGGEKSLASASQNGNTKYISKYPVVDSDDSPTVTVDERIANADGGMPEDAEAHHINNRWMGPWMSADLVIVQPKSYIDGPGRYCVRWAGGEDKIVLEAWRHSNDQIAIRTHAPEQTSTLTEVEREGDSVLFARPDGSDLHIKVIGIVVYPSDSVRLMTQGMADTASRILGGG
jgi:transcriptional regulator with XRE-family HTH domain